MELAEQVDPEDWHGIMDRFFADPHRRRASLRGHGQPVHRRRHHGAVRRADRARGPRAARLLRGAAPARRAARATRSELRRDARARLLGAHGPQLRRGRRRQDRRRPAHGLHRAGPHRRPGGAHGAARRARARCTSRRTPRALVAGYFAARRPRRVRHQGRTRAAARLSSCAASGRCARASTSRGRAASRASSAATREMAGARGGAGARASTGSGQVVGVVAEAGVGKSRLCFEFAERCRAARHRGHRRPPASPHGQVDARSCRCSSCCAASSASASATTPRGRARKIAGTPAAARRRLHARTCRCSSTSSASPTRRTRSPRIDPEARQRQLFGVVKRLIHDAHASGEPRGAPVRGSALDRRAPATPFARQTLDRDRRRRRATLLLRQLPPGVPAPRWMQRRTTSSSPLAPLGDGGHHGAAARPARQRRRRWRRSASASARAPPAIRSSSRRSCSRWSTAASWRGGSNGATTIRLTTAGRPRSQIPATVQAVLAARIDRLGERDKAVLQTAAVIGKEFAEPVLRRVVGSARHDGDRAGGAGRGAARADRGRAPLRSAPSIPTSSTPSSTR